MAKLYNLARMTTATTGTGTITLGSAVSGYLTFALAGVANADVIDYAIKDGTNSEHGTGTYTSSGTTLTRTVTKSTNSNAAINLSGSAEVFISPRAETLNDASVITTGTMAAARLGGGTADANNILHGNQNFIQNTRKLLNTLTASSSASLDDTTSLTSTFSSYEIVLENIIPATSGQDLRIQVRSAGAFQTTTYLAGNFQYNGSTPATASVNLTTGIPLTVGTNTSNSSSYGVSGTIRVYTPTLAATAKMWTGHVAHMNAANNAIMFSTLGGFWNNAAALDGFRLIMSSGNITSGTMKVYGL